MSNDGNEVILIEFNSQTSNMQYADTIDRLQLSMYVKRYTGFPGGSPIEINVPKSFHTLDNVGQDFVRGKEQTHRLHLDDPEPYPLIVGFYLSIHPNRALEHSTGKDAWIFRHITIFLETRAGERRLFNRTVNNPERYAVSRDENDLTTEYGFDKAEAYVWLGNTID